MRLKYRCFCRKILDLETTTKKTFDKVKGALLNPKLFNGASLGQKSSIVKKELLRPKYSGLSSSPLSPLLLGQPDLASEYGNNEYFRCSHSQNITCPLSESISGHQQRPINEDFFLKKNWTTMMGGGEES
jgi:hypothetical protein